jgi:MarR family transcriptional repressor of emrRAB
MASEDRTANLLGALAIAVTDLTEHGLAAAAGLSHTDAAALLTLANYADGKPLSALLDATGLSHAGVVRLADRLEVRGLVRRLRGAGGDGRAVGLELTPAGRRLVAAARAGRSGALAGPLAALTRGERRALVPLLEKLLTAATSDARASRVICRLCDGDACGHPARCPVTQAARAAAA